MLAESTSAQALEKSVIADFNTRLASRITQFGKNNTNVCVAVAFPFFKYN